MITLYLRVIVVNTRGGKGGRGGRREGGRGLENGEVVIVVKSYVPNR